jgi:hypothetical protein
MTAQIKPDFARITMRFRRPSVARAAPPAGVNQGADIANAARIERHVLPWIALSSDEVARSVLKNDDVLGIGTRFHRVGNHRK